MGIRRQGVWMKTGAKGKGENTQSGHICNLNDRKGQHAGASVGDGDAAEKQVWLEGRQRR